jgi:hypothetical protein
LNSYRARKKIVAYAITSFLALCTVALGLVLGYSGLSDRHFLFHGEREALDICLNNPLMDCDPRRWPVLLSVGAAFALVGLVLLLRLGNKLRRLLQAGSR